MHFYLSTANNWVIGCARAVRILQVNKAIFSPARWLVL